MGNKPFSKTKEKETKKKNEKGNLGYNKIKRSNRKGGTIIDIGCPKMKRGKGKFKENTSKKKNNTQNKRNIVNRGSKGRKEVYGTEVGGRGKQIDKGNTKKKKGGRKGAHGKILKTSLR
jgi:hypothetical protein